LKNREEDNVVIQSNENSGGDTAQNFNR